MSAVALRTHELSKRYVLGSGFERFGSLREALVNGARAALRIGRDGRSRIAPDELWALRDLSLEVERGEVLGLIGSNGAGKSTLLKVLSRITEPTSGWAEVHGRVGSLLEVGTGFHPELTGRENVYLNGAILGMSRREIRRQFDRIVEFAELERFLDTPVKRYSSGMYVRLAFAVAAHLEPEILLVDEVLAVGDAAFQKRCLGKMEEVAHEGRTVVFVSHNLAIIRALCTRGVLLSHGRVAADGPTEETIDAYMRTLERAAAGDLLARRDRDSEGWQELLIRRVAVGDARDHNGAVVAGRPMRIDVDLTDVRPAMECRMTIVNFLGHPVAALDSSLHAPVDVRDPAVGTRIVCDVPQTTLVPGRYRLDVQVKAESHVQDGLEAAAFFDVEPGLVGGRPTPAGGAAGDLVLEHSWRLPS